MSAANLRAVDDDETPPLKRRVSGYWAFYGLHGGAGISTLSGAMPGSRCARSIADLDALGFPPVIAVCRSTGAGLAEAQRFARLLDDDTPLRSLGLLVIADAQRVPRELMQLADLAAGSYPRHWYGPWVEAWRRGASPSSPAELPVPWAQLFREFMSISGMEQAVAAAATQRRRS